jgi:hypothetical protein
LMTQVRSHANTASGHATSSSIFPSHPTTSTTWRAKSPPAHAKTASEVHP